LLQDGEYHLSANIGRIHVDLLLLLLPKRRMSKYNEIKRSTENDTVKPPYNNTTPPPPRRTKLYKKVRRPKKLDKSLSCVANNMFTKALQSTLDLVTPPENFPANTTTQGCVAKV
jgi:hypothetical protein